MIYTRETNIEKVTNEILDVLERNKVSIGLLDKVLSDVRNIAHFNTVIQNPKENEDLKARTGSFSYPFESSKIVPDLMRAIENLTNHDKV